MRVLAFFLQVNENMAKFSQMLSHIKGQYAKIGRANLLPDKVQDIFCQESKTHAKGKCTEGPKIVKHSTICF